MVVFIIPVYNEAGNIQTLLVKTKEKMRQLNLPFKVILVDDGSSDNTVEMAREFADKASLSIYSHHPNKGVGEAFRVGFRKALETCEDTDIIITKEADNTSDLNIIEKLIEKIHSGYDLALASCYAKRGRVTGTTFFRIILSKSANTLLRLYMNLKEVSTYSSFYRAYNPRALKKLSNEYNGKLIEESGFECMVELLIKFSRNKDFRITEIPMVLDGSRRVGKSSMRIRKTIKGFLKVIIKDLIQHKLRVKP